MDFEKLTDDRYYCFGCRFYKNAEIDYNALAEELEEVKHYYAMMAFEADDVGFNIRLLTYSPAKWLFEGADYDVTEEEFKQLIETDQFKKFCEVVPHKIHTAIGALQIVDEEELKKHGIKKEDINKVIRDALKILTIVKAGCKKPIMKK